MTVLEVFKPGSHGGPQGRNHLIHALALLPVRVVGGALGGPRENLRLAHFDRTTGLIISPDISKIRPRAIDLGK